MNSGQIIHLIKTRPFHFLLIAVLFNIGVACYAADYFVDDDCTGQGDGSSADPFCFITYALATASTTGGDTVYVHDGIYDERVTMKTGVDLRNVSGEQPTITITNTATPDNLVLFDGVDDCTLDGFLIDASGMDYTATEYAIVKITGPGTGLSVSNCELKGAQTAGDAVVYSGIKLAGQVSVQIIGNTISDNKYTGISTGVDSIFDSTVMILGNTVLRNGYAGIRLTGSTGSGSGNSIIIGGNAGDGNIIADNGFWSVYGSGIRLTTLQGVTVNNNAIFTNGRNGILLEGVDTVSPHITGNTIYNNFAAGINIGGSSTLTIGPNNEVFDNGLAGISFFTAENTSVVPTVPASSGPVTITGNAIHTNARTGISVIDHVTGPVTIHGNTIYQNEKAGIGFFNACTADITENDIYDHTGAAGIFTGTWAGDTTSPIVPATSLQFNRTNGPALLTIYRNKIHNNLTGMRLDHASGTIGNNLVHHNARAGIRFSGNDVSPFEPFGTAWGIAAIINNTVVDNGTGTDNTRQGSGIYYDDINNVTGREFFDPPYPDENQGPRTIENNIAAFNARTGIRDAACTTARDYNLYYDNNLAGIFIPPQIVGCATAPQQVWIGNPHELFTDPLFVDRVDYRLQSGSPGKNSGSDGLDMGAYGGSNPITW